MIKIPEVVLKLAWLTYVSALLFVVFYPTPPGSNGIFGIFGLEGPVDRVLNVFLLVPLAILILVSFRDISLITGLIAGPCVSIIIELTQFLIPGRISDYLDVVANSLGYVITYLLLKNKVSDSHILSSVKRDIK